MTCWLLSGGSFGAGAGSQGKRYGSSAGSGQMYCAVTASMTPPQASLHTVPKKRPTMQPSAA